MISYLVKVEVNGKPVERVYQHKGTTGVLAIEKLVDYLISEEFEKGDISNPESEIFESSDELELRVSNCMAEIKFYIEKGVFFSAEPTTPDDIYYIDTLSSKNILLHDPELTSVILKTALDAHLVLGKLGIEFTVKDSGVTVYFDKDNPLIDNDFLDSITGSLAVKKTQLTTMNNFLEAIQNSQATPSKYEY